LAGASGLKPDAQTAAVMAVFCCCRALWNAGT
jgi:hypothetical protein